MTLLYFLSFYTPVCPLPAQMMSYERKWREMRRWWQWADEEDEQMKYDSQMKNEQRLKDSQMMNDNQMMRDEQMMKNEKMMTDERLGDEQKCKTSRWWMKSRWWRWNFFSSIYWSEEQLRDETTMSRWWKSDAASQCHCGRLGRGIQPPSIPNAPSTPLPTLTHTQKASKTLVFPLFDSCPQMD